MAERKTLSKKTRFDVFKRDQFTCQYCGQTPPKVILEIDHIRPVSQGGDDSKDNLITACFDCNRGKGAEALTAIPQTILEKAEVLAEKEEQIKAFEKLQKAKRRRIERSIDAVEKIFCDVFNQVFSDHFRRSVGHFIDQLGEEKTCWAMDRAISKGKKPQDTTKYFCGICWNLIRDGE